MNVVTGCVIFLGSQGVAALAHRRWRDPAPGQAVVVVTLVDDWAAMRTSAAAPALRVLITAAPSAGQDDAEAIALESARRVRAALHRPQRGAQVWGDLRVLSSLHVGSGGPAEAEGQRSWRIVTQTYEIEQA